VLDVPLAHRRFPDTGRRLGASEFVIGPGTGRYRIEVSGTGLGEFDLVARPAPSRKLSVPANANGVRLAATGEPTVFER
jgi:hypothetical protein